MNNRNADDPLTFGNKIYKIEFMTKDFTDFGCKYKFTLKEAVGGVPEYVVPHRKFLELAYHYGLEYIESYPFKEFINRFVDRRDRERFRATKEEWEVIDLYRVYVFRSYTEK